jgi:hypothetical protein
MKKTMIFCLICLLALCFTVNTYAVRPANMEAFFRSGQVFITWDEVTNGQKYIIYWSTSPITAGDLTTANYRYEVAQGSAGNKQLAQNTGTGSMFESRGCVPVPDFTRNVITPLDPATSGNAAQVPSTKGLIVFTTHQAGDYYYAVTAVVGGTEDKTVDNGNTVGPVSETVEDPEPVLIWQSDTMLARIYLQYTDVDSVNPTHTGTYAWPYWLGVKRGYDPTGNRGTLRLHVEGYSGKIRGTNYGQYNDFDGVTVRPHGSGDWWFGWSQTYQYDTSTATYGSSNPVVDEGPIYNYVQARIMNFLKWMIFDEPYYSHRIDTNRVYVVGGSMGGGGSMMLCMNYPDFFAYGTPRVPPTNFLETDWTWLRNCEASWGTGTDDNIKVHFTGWRSERLEQEYGGMNCHDWLNLQETILLMEGTDLPWIAMCSGGQDPSVDYPAQGREHYQSLNDSRRAWSGRMDSWRGHYCEGNGHHQLGSIRKNHSIIAFSDAGHNANLPLPLAPVADPQTSYYFNHHLIYSTPFYSAGGYQDQVDEMNRYEVVLVSWKVPYGTDLGDDVADITPRRLQNFVVIPGRDYIVTNTAVSDTNTVYQIDTITADTLGLVTFRGFQVKAGDRSTGGSRFIMTPVQPVQGAEYRQIKERSSIKLTCTPNPFHTSVDIRVLLQISDFGFSIGHVGIYDISGKLVTQLEQSRNPQSTIKNSYKWHATGHPAGVYIVKVNTENAELKKRLVLIK